VGNNSFNKDPLAKFQTFQSVSVAGLIGITPYTVKGENTLRIKTVGAAGSTILIYGRIESEDVFNVIGTIVGNTTISIDISLIDYVKFVCSIYGGSEFEFIVSGFLPTVAAISTITGEVSIKAPTGPFLVTNATVSDVAADPLGAALAARTSISIQNEDLVDYVYFGNADVTDSGATKGRKIGPNEDFHIDLDDSNVFYLIASAGKTPAINIVEIAST